MNSPSALTELVTQFIFSTFGHLTTDSQLYRTPNKGKGEANIQRMDFITQLSQ